MAKQGQTQSQQLRMTGPVLKTLAMFLERHPRPLSGADIVNEKRIFSGTLYPVLERLEKAGWLESRWEEIDPSKAGRPRKRLYILTGLGARKASYELEALGINISRQKAKAIGRRTGKPEWAL